MMDWQTLKNQFNKTFRPETRFLSLFDAVQPQRQPQEFFGRSGLPHESMNRLGRKILQLSSHKLYIDNILVEGERQPRIINLREIFGCSATKYKGGSDYNIMGQRRYIDVPKTPEEANELEKRTFDSSHGGISRAQDRANVVELAWDKTKWFDNSDGSHRSSALWVYDKEHEVDRPIDCDVAEINISPAFLELAREKNIYVLRVNNIDGWLDLVIEFDRFEHELMQGITFEQLKDEYPLARRSKKPQNEGDFVLIVDKQSPISAEIAVRMQAKGVFNLSEWADDPAKFGWDNQHFVVLPATGLEN